VKEIRYFPALCILKKCVVIVIKNFTMGKLNCLYSPLGGIYSLKACHVVLQIDIYPTLASVYFRVNFSNLQRKIYPSAVIFHNSVYCAKLIFTNLRIIIPIAMRI
jgi:hypothetical protein